MSNEYQATRAKKALTKQEKREKALAEGFQPAHDAFAFKTGCKCDYCESDDVFLERGVRTIARPGE